jgi:hypothetical protein
MSHEGIFFIKKTKGIFFGIFPWILIFENTSNANLLDVFYIDN